MHGCMYNQAMGLRRILQPGAVIVRVDPRYFCPAEVEALLGDPTKAQERLGWVPEISVRELCAEMVAEDLKVAKRHAFLKAHGHETPLSVEVSASSSRWVGRPGCGR